MKPRIGDFVEVRGRSWLVREVNDEASGAFVVGLVGVDDDAQGREADVVWDAEIAPKVFSDDPWDALSPSAKGADADAFGAHLRIVRWNTATAADRDLFQAPFRAGIRLDPYQLAPLRKALALPRVNVLIADDTGLGKTVEAGLVVRELMMRRRADYIVVAAPASMTGQWREELRAKFGLDFTIVDREFLGASRRANGFQVNPWRASSTYIVSHALLIDETYASGLRDALGVFRPRGMFVLDEAHHAAPSAASAYAVDSQFTKVVRDLADRFEHRLFLTATPHNGHSNSFSALLEMLDPQRFTRGVPVRPRDHKSIMVRRLKSDLKAMGLAFPTRIVERIELEVTAAQAPEVALAQMLSAYGRMRNLRLRRGQRPEGAGRMAFVHLQQRLFSSVPAFAKTLRAHAKTLERLAATFEAGVRERPNAEAAESADRVADLFGEEGGEEIERALDEDNDRSAETRTENDAAGATLDELRGELQAVAAMQAAADRIGTKPDARVKWLVDWIRANLMAGEDWNDRRLIVFTEWEDTRRWLQAKLEAEFCETKRGEERIDVFTGATGLERREAVKRRFNADPEKEPLRILICTDAAREGLNLQTRCADLVHFDLPWNPARLEQRNGRIDRKLQPSPEVRCRYFNYRHRPEDVVLAALVRKSDLIREQLGSMACVLGDTIAARLETRGLDVEDPIGQAQEIENEHDEDGQATATSELDDETEARRRGVVEEIADLQRRLDRSAARVGVDLGQLEHVFGVAMARVGVDLARLEGSPIGDVRSFRLLPDDPSLAADRSWGDALDEIRVRPRLRRERYADWRAAAPVRAVTFAPPILPDGRDADDVVQVHLEHRLVKKALAKLSSHGFRRDLDRVCAIQGAGARGRAILLGRLIVFGSQGQRLHEEVLTVSALKSLDGVRTLQALGERGEDTSLEELETALRRARPVSEATMAIVRQGCRKDVDDLSGEIEKRATASLVEATKSLAEVARLEAKSIETVLRDQITRIERRQREEEEGRALLLEAMSPDQRRQLEADRLHWGRKRERLALEIESEPERIRHSFEVAAHKVEAVGMVYVMPEGS